MFKNMLRRFYHKIAFVAPGGWSIRPWLHKKRGVKIGKNVWISQSVYIDELHPEGVTIGDNASIGMRTSIFTHFYWGERKENNYGRVVIGKNAFIGPHCLILPNVKIGEGAVIKGGTVITRNIPAFTFWGTPAAEPIAKVTTPLTAEFSYDEFVKGLKPVKRRKRA